MLRFIACLMLAALALLTRSALADDAVEYNAELAAALGADAYGMRPYVMAMLKAGPNPPDDPAQAAEVQAGHMAHIRQLAEAGQLVLAGPYMDDGAVRGLFVFATDDMDQARAWTEADPAVQAGLLAMELRPWYGSAALMQVNAIHASIAREQP
ncbi:MAG: YciI family protein [Pseudomonadota bacterium]